jgi:uncharacterized protein with FMN-binding domain
VVVVTEVGFMRRVAPAVILAAAGGALLYLLPGGADSDVASAEDIGALDSGAFASPSAPATAPAGGSSAAPAPAQRVIDGDAIDFRFGTVQVKVLLEGSTIKDIATVTAPGGNYLQYTRRAIPTMKAEILQAQSTKVAVVSGASYTSLAYAQSVQSALDKA